MEKKQPNINYELSNNDDFDSGLIKSKKKAELMNKNEKMNRELRKGKKIGEVLEAQKAKKLKLIKIQSNIQKKILDMIKNIQLNFIKKCS